MKELDDVLQHYGVKGMKWGVRRTDAQLSKARSKVQNGVKKANTRVKDEWNSMSRERQWKKVLNDVDKMTTKQLNQTANRIQMENDLKRLSKKSKVGTKKDKQDYRNRAKMSNEELSRKVSRLRAKDGLHRAVNQASRSQREFGERVVNTAGPLAVKYALTKNVGAGDIIKAVTNNKSARAEAKRSILDQVTKKYRD